MRRSKVSCSSRLYSEHQAVYTLRVQKNHTSKVQSQGLATRGRNVFSHRGARVTAAEANVPAWRSTKAHFKNSSMFWRNWSLRILFSWSFHTSAQNSLTIPFLDRVLTLRFHDMACFWVHSQSILFSVSLLGLCAFTIFVMRGIIWACIT